MIFSTLNNKVYDIPPKCVAIDGWGGGGGRQNTARKLDLADQALLSGSWHPPLICALPRLSS